MMARQMLPLYFWNSRPLNFGEIMTTSTKLKFINYSIPVERKCLDDENKKEGKLKKKKFNEDTPIKINLNFIQKYKAPIQAFLCSLPTPLTFSSSHIYKG